MIRTLYSLATQLAQPLLRRKLRRRGAAEPGYLTAVEERFGHYTHPASPQQQGALWIHAVSLGETRAAAILIAELRKREPGIKLLLTHGTATGRAEGAKLIKGAELVAGRTALHPGDQQAWLPWDTPGAVARFLAHFKPRAGVLMETEVWPNLVAGCTRAGVPVALANGRLSDKSLRSALRLRPLSRPAYAALSAVWAQTEADAQRLGRAGATVSGVFGNLKFDAQPDAKQLAQGRAWREAFGRPVILFASSREGEEAEFLQAIKKVNPSPPGEGPESGLARQHSHAPQLLIVPRHPQRFSEVAALIKQAGYKVSKRSAWPNTGPLPASDDPPTIWLGDTLGEMPLYYGFASVALLGGSFAPLGGQNLIEAAACACPVVMGPHTFNFAEAAELAVQAQAALRTDSLPSALRQATDLAADPEARKRIADSAFEFANAHRGTAARTVDALRAQLLRA